MKFYRKKKENEKFTIFWFFVCLFVCLLLISADVLPMGWFRGVEPQPESSYHQSVANTADARLAALKENRAKHAQIASEARAGKYQPGTNFEHVSAQKQAVLDRPAQEYFKNSWFRPENENAGVGNSELAKQLFQQNKSLIKENYRLANKLADAQATQNTLTDLSKVQINTSPLGILSTTNQLLQVGADKGSQTQVGQAYYKNIKDPNGSNRYVIKRSGTSNQDRFVPEFSKETVQEYADRYTAANNAIKPTGKSDLITMIQQENSTLANKTIPDAANVDLGKAYNLGSNLHNQYKSGLALRANTTAMYDKFVQPYFTSGSSY